MSTLNPNTGALGSDQQKAQNPDQNGFFMVKRRNNKLLTSINEDLHQINEEKKQDALINKKTERDSILKNAETSKITNYSQLLLQGNRNAKTTLLNFDLTEPGDSHAQITENLQGESGSSQKKAS